MSPATHQVTDSTGRRWQARKILNKVRPEQWMRLATGHGTKGTREYDWAWLDIRADDTPDGQETGTSALVARRHRYTGKLSYFRCWAPGPTALATFVEIICCRWRIEETFQLAKGFTGLDQGQVTCWNSWMRWSLFSLIAAAVLALTLTTVGEKTRPTRPARFVPLTCPELVRLLRALVLPAPVRDRDHVLHWTVWRRRHQAASTACRRHRLPPATSPPAGHPMIGTTAAVTARG